MSTVRDEAGSSSSPWDKSCERFSIDEIRRATDNFDEKRVIGTGGFGKVYKADVGMTGVFAAIKRLDHSRSSQGEPQFWAEIETLSKLRHCHLVSLLGYCNDGQEMILVYEFMPNGTLEDHRARLPWLQRLKICLGAARVLDYLHTGTGTKHGVVHRDVKSSNILLDHNWDAKISDFGLSKIGPTNQTNSFVKTGVKGTIGYIDPCYFSTLRLTRKSDVYSFGVVLFEVLCGRAAVDKSLDEEQWGLAGWVQKCMRDGKLVQIVDSNIRDQISPKCLKAFAGIAGLCLHNDQDQRPTMAEVVVKLFSIVSLQERMNSSPAKWTLKEKVLSFFPAKNQVISDQNKKAGALEFNRNALGGKISESLQYEFESGDKNVDASEFQRHSDETLESLQYEFESIRIATNNFSEANIIRQDETCSIYKGIMEGKIIAVKRLDVLPSHLQQQFRNEMLSLLNLKHKNLVELLGYCMEGSRPCLIYNIVQYTSLDRLIFGHASRDLHLHWMERGDIIVGVAEAILYLHEEASFKIIHHDIKPDHILLDKRLRPKLSGLGLATSRDRAVVCESSLAGTKRYMAPECFTIPGYVISEKADVYSFGVLTLETFLGHRCQDYGYSLRDIWRNWWKGAYSSLIDHSSIMMRYIQIGLLCVQDDVSHRPAMASVVRMLTDTSMSLTVPVIPECHQYDNTRSNLDDTNDPEMALHHHEEVGHYSTRVVDGSSSEDVHGYSLNDNNSDPGTPADEGYISEELDTR